jgi:NAD(P)-dependent dehydrogenase (short-subunit alcohol dehydrogenase family)
VFGPVLSATPFDTEEEAVALANGTAYGLGGYVHTQNLRRAHQVAAQLDAGMIHVNGSGAQAVIPQMRKRGGGRIVNQVSGGAFPAVSIYGISKLALVGLTTTRARQLGRERIAVNAIAPGNTTSDAGKLLTPDDSPFIKFLEMNVAMRVRGAPDELVGTLLLLCSQAGAWITGQVIHVDGGWVLRP